jgi:hypothetical protein
LRNRIKRVCAVLLPAFVFGGGIAVAYVPSIADLDAAARSVGNRREVAERIGHILFKTAWSAEVSQISANRLGTHLIVGIRLWGVKFHRPITRQDFIDEVLSLAQETFAAAPETEEIDLWASVPIAVAKGVIVTGDLAKPTSRTVFSLTIRRGETPASLQARVSRSGVGVFWDSRWARSAFKEPT